MAQVAMAQVVVARVVVGLVLAEVPEGRAAAVQERPAGAARAVLPQAMPAASGVQT
ncbi:hypothetical protein [Ramlibacter sp.]|uniref:hypothetical protein n=1 Tax=Ramlibacter sp. TaxID=1917967 RepID=UPI0017942D8F|nr:hypothetical protein [Ramlibacter sp.]MBA2674145.1 hypothetical protein [Ramlibacter sp.]